MLMYNNAHVTPVVADTSHGLGVNKAVSTNVHERLACVACACNGLTEVACIWLAAAKCML